MCPPTRILHLKTICHALDASQPADTNYHLPFSAGNHWRTHHVSARRAHTSSWPLPHIPHKTYCHLRVAIGTVLYFSDHYWRRRFEPIFYYFSQQSFIHYLSRSLKQTETPAETVTLSAGSITSQFSTTCTEEDIAYGESGRSFVNKFSKMSTHIKITPAHFQHISKATTRTASG